MSLENISPVLLSSLVDSDCRTLEAREPTKAMLCLEQLAEGNTWEEIAEATGFSFNQISKVKARHEVAIEVRRKQLAADGFEMAEGLRLLAKQKLEMLANNPDALAKVNIRDLVLSYGIAVDKGMQALGENKVVVEHKAGKPSLEDAMKAIADARAALQKEAVEI
jgi:hypothetical protein